MAEGHEFTDDVKNSIMNIVKEKDSGIAEVLITDDRQVFNEIESVVEALLNGKSYDDQVNKINSIIESIR